MHDSWQKLPVLCRRYAELLYNPRVLARDPLDRLIKRERLFIRLRYGALLLLLGIVALDPRQQTSLTLTLYVVAAGILLNFLAWLLLRIRRLVPMLVLLSAVADSLFLLYYIFTTGGGQSDLWSLVFVLIAATALRYGVWGGLVIALAFGAIHLTTGFVESAIAPTGVYSSAVRTLAYVVMALLVGWVMRYEEQLGRVESEQAQLELQRKQFDIEAFAKLTGTMSANTNYQVTLQQMLDLSLRGLRTREPNDGAIAGMILLFDQSQDETLFVAAHYNLQPPDDTRRSTPIVGAMRGVLRTADPIMLKAARRDPLLCQFNVTQQFPAAVILPLRAGLSLYGVAVFVGGEPLLETFKHRLELMEAYATQAAIAVQNAQLYAQLRAEHDHVVDSEEKVRHEVARDLHDGPVNSVASITMGIDFARTLLHDEPAKAKEELDRLHRLASKTARDMRMTMYRLRPLALESAGLSAALEQYASRLQAEQSQPQIHFSGPNPNQFESRLSSNAATMVFDIAREAVGNAIKHAEAKNIWIVLRVSADWLIASVTDDGKGFDVNAVRSNYAKRGSLGLVNIQERAVLAQGDAEIESAPGKGTTVTARVPLEE